MTDSGSEFGFFRAIHKTNGWQFHLHKNCDLQNWNVDTSREVDSLETSQGVI